MDFKDMMKFQVMSQIGNHQHSHASKSNETFNIWPLLCQFFLMACIGLFEEIAKSIPKHAKTIQAKIIDKFRDKVEKAIEPRNKQISDVAVPLSKRHFLNSMSMMRVYCNTEGSKNAAKTSDDSNNMVDAVLEQISKLDNVPSFQLIDKAQIMISYKETPIQMTNDIFAKIEDLTYVGDQLGSIKLTLLSNTVSAADISKYVKGLYNTYVETMKNSLGSNIYFFDQKERDGNARHQLPIETTPASLANQKRMMISSAPKQLTFTMTQFHSNKQFSNIYGKEVRNIEQRVNFFKNNKKWYDSKGIPYQLGLLLSGIPGSGKTSAIRAIANLTKRHIINVNFSNITTATQLKNLFYSEKLHVYTDSSLANTQSYHIPIEQRLYVLEEIDAIGDILKQRTSGSSSEPTINDELTLMEILTVLDGTMEIPGRILIMTSNHPEVLDRALIRPGRIDLTVKFTYATQELIVEMYEAYMDRAFDKNNTYKLPDKVLSPAEVGQVLFRHFDLDHSEKEIIEDFVNTANEKNGQNLLTLSNIEPNISKDVANDVKQFPPLHNDIMTDLDESEFKKMALDLSEVHEKKNFKYPAKEFTDGRGRSKNNVAQSLQQLTGRDLEKTIKKEDQSSLTYEYTNESALCGGNLFGEVIPLDNNGKYMNNVNNKVVLDELSNNNITAFNAHEEYATF